MKFCNFLCGGLIHLLLDLFLEVSYILMLLYLFKKIIF